MLTRAVTAGILIATLTALAACGGSNEKPKPRAARPYSALDTRAARAVTLNAAVFRRPIAAYRRHVARELGQMAGDLVCLESAVRAGNMSAARAAWLSADARYETIGAAYGAFGQLDARINGLPGGLQGGVRSSRFTGLHRIELALWGRRSLRDAAPYVPRLRRDVSRLRARVGTMKIDALDFGLRAHEVLEDSLQLQLAGRASPWASSALTALASNISGTRVVLGGLERIAGATNGYPVALARKRLDVLSAALGRLRRDGRYPRWDSLPQRERERISGLTAAAAEQLAFVPGLVDPRPPRPAVNPLPAG
jgi:iron uptake system EfeUOB component EfeO/EfeM